MSDGPRLSGVFFNAAAIPPSALPRPAIAEIRKLSSALVARLRRQRDSGWLVNPAAKGISAKSG